MAVRFLAQMLRMGLDPRKELRSLTLRTLSNDVVIGLMGVTLEECKNEGMKE